MDLNIILRAFDKASPEFTKMSRYFKQVFNAMAKDAEALSRALDGVGKTAVVAGGAMTASLGIAAKQFGDFEDGITDVYTLLSKEDIQKFGGKLEDASFNAIKLGFAVNDANKALFNTISNLGMTEAAMNTYSSAQKLAIGGATQLSTALEGINAIQGAYGDNVAKADEIANAFFAAQRDGATNVELMASNIGKVSSTAKLAGVDFRELLAITAHLSKPIGSTERATTSLNQALVGLLAPSAEAEKALKKYNVPIGATEIRTKGLGYTLRKLAEAVKANPDALTEMITSTEALTGMAALTDEKLKAIDETVRKMNKDYKDGTGLTDAFNMKMNIFNKAMGVFNGTLKETFILVGSDLAPAIKFLAGGLGLVLKIVNFIPGPIRAIIVALAAIGGIGLLAIGSLSLVLSGMLNTLNILAPAFAARLAPAIAQAAVAAWGFAGAWLAANWPILAIIAAVGALVGLGVIVYKNWKPWLDAIGKAANSVGGFFSGGPEKKSVPAAESAGPIKKFDVGSTGITRTGLAIVHKGEKILPAGRNAGGTIIHFAPQITASGGNAQNIKAEVEAAFEVCMQKFKSKKARLAYGG